MVLLRLYQNTTNFKLSRFSENSIKGFICKFYLIQVLIVITDGKQTTSKLFTKENSKFYLEQVLIVITDGKQTTTKAYTELSVASQGVKNKGVIVYAVGVGKGADAAELREIASSQENVFISASLKELQPIAVEIRKKLCDCKFALFEWDKCSVCLF